MLGPRILKLADGEELISFEVDDRATPLSEDPQEVLLNHRRAAEEAPEQTPAELGV